ncbi:phosphatase PAP2 family protein [Thermoflexus hugenholtzii]|uniref:PAP2 superfamily protein n=1 Tax=Thermoflexus hugenholtzii JAD2 TaxID=877466 RepID=A0A212R1V6_9CHLR|nr:phosphatase PAP2 family protein [Thermoflexus hugenholtzii]SNB66004.1 PAP2 superfamily protein [Thermoflexus hugenholtzii JAD2]
MPDWIHWQIEGIVALQALQPPWALPLWRAITGLGEEQAFLLILAALLWGYRKREALYAATALLLGAYLTFVLKDLFAMPRPFQVAPDRVQVWLPGGEALGYGLPSGHALNAAAMWGTLAGMIRSGPFTFFAVLLILLVGLSRIVLGVHFPHDVVAGWAVGALVALATLRLFPGLVRRLPHSALSKATLAAGAVLALFLLHPTRETAVPLGAWLGMAWGVLVESQTSGGLDPGGAWMQRGIRLALGLVSLGAVYVLLGMAFTGLFGEAAGMPGLRLFRYLLVGLYVTAGAPLLFLRLGLARSQRTIEVPPTDPSPRDL